MVSVSSSTPACMGVPACQSTPHQCTLKRFPLSAPLGCRAGIMPRDSRGGRRSTSPALRPGRRKAWCCLPGVGGALRCCCARRRGARSSRLRIILPLPSAVLACLLAVRRLPAAVDVGSN